MLTTVMGLCLILGGLLFSHSALAAPVAGSLIKGESLSSVYYYSSNGKRYAFPSERVFKTWYSDFSNVVTIPDAELEKIQLGGNANYRPGVRMIKVESSPSVYVVSRGGVLHWVKTEAVATELYGVNWSKFVDDVTDALFVNYTIGEDFGPELGYIPSDQVSQTPTIDIDKNIAVLKPNSTLEPTTQSDKKEYGIFSSITKNGITTDLTSESEGEIRSCGPHTISFRAAMRASSIDAAITYTWISSTGTEIGLQRFTFSEPDQVFATNYEETFSTSTTGTVGIRIFSPGEQTQTIAFALRTDACTPTPDPSEHTIPASGLLPPDLVGNLSSLEVISPEKWRTRAMALPFVDFRREVIGDTLKVSSDGDYYQVIVPNIGPDAEPFARLSLKKLKMSAEATQLLFGRGPFTPGNLVVAYVLNTTDASGPTGALMYVDGSPRSEWYFYSEAAFLRHINLALPENAYTLHDWNRATGDHELVHRFVVGTDINHMLNEGLANYIPRRLDGRRIDYTCTDTGYTEPGSTTLIPYLRESDGYDARRLYVSGECFWWILQDRYGTNALTRVMSERLAFISRDLREPDGPTLAGSSLNRNIRRLLLPIFGSSVWTNFAGFGASPDAP